MFVAIPKKLYPMLAFTTGYLVLFGLYSVMSGNIEFIYYLAVVLFFFFLLVKKYDVLGLTVPVLWALSLWGLLHMAGGNVIVQGSVLYNLQLIPVLLKYDQLVHAFGFGTTTIVAWQLLRPHLAPHFSVKTISVLLVMIGIGAGALNEVVEFLAVLFIPDTNVGGYYNTGFDMIFNLLGALIGLALIWKQLSSQKK